MQDAGLVRCLLFCSACIKKICVNFGLKIHHLIQIRIGTYFGTKLEATHWSCPKYSGLKRSSDFNAMEKKVLYGHCPFVFWLFTQLRKRSPLILLCFVWSLITKLSAALFSSSPSSHQTFCLLPLLVRITWCHISINQGLE